MSNAPTSRVTVGVLALILAGSILSIDLGQSGAPDLFDAPPALALGSGQAPTGAHCTAN